MKSLITISYGRNYIKENRYWNQTQGTDYMNYGSEYYFLTEWNINDTSYICMLLQFFRMDKKSVLYPGGKFQASHIVRFTLTLCHRLWTISSIQWKNSQALNSPLTVLVENTIRNSLYLIICPLHLFIQIIWTLRMHHWPCLMRNQVRYDISSYMYKNTFTLSKMFFNRPLYLVRFKQMSRFKR